MNFIHGLKLWSTNKNYIQDALILFEKEVFNYIELYVKPATLVDYSKLWEDLNIPFTIHAPHFGDGLNFSLREKHETNMKMALEAIEYADRLKAKYIIFHPGVYGNIEETIKQINELNDKRIIIENKPQLGQKDEKCVGHTPEEIKHILKKTKCGFCLDIGHAICSANSKKINPIEYIKEFIALKPAMYHLTDGKYESQYDSHLHFTEGNYPIKDILKLIKDNSIITNEAKKDSFENLDDFISDMKYLKNLSLDI